MHDFKRPTIQRLSHPDVDFSTAPEWATHAGYDSHGWGWYDHVPYIYASGEFVKGLLGDKGYPTGKFKYFTSPRHPVRVKDSTTTGIEPLTYIARPSQVMIVKRKPVDWTAKRERWTELQACLIATTREIQELEAEAKAAGLLFLK